MLNKLLFCLCFIFGVVVGALAQNGQITSVAHNRHIINSTVLNEQRSVLVRVPENYSKSTDKYAVVYMLDGHGPYLSMMPGIIENQAWGGQMPEMILVSIQNTNRTRDLTPTDPNNSGSAGGADKFLQFIETEVIPTVEKNYRTHPYRIFAGHSFGGLTVVHSLLTRPHLFDAYIAASPYLHWDSDFPLRRAEEVFKQKKDWKKTVFLALGDEPAYVNAFNSFKDLLDRTKPNNLDYEFQRYPDEVHRTTVLRAFYSGLRKVYSGWLPPRMRSTAEMENHYKKLSEKFGFEVKMPEDALRKVAGELLKENKLPEAITAFKRNIELFPNSLLSYAGLAQTLEKSGQLKEAADNFEKGYKLSETMGDARLARVFKSDFERISAKLK